MDALFLVDKPPGLTSHDVVEAVRRVSGERRVGHGGTLDPLARGLLIICTGRATRLSEFLLGHPKTYRAAITLGVETETDDAEGRVLAVRPVRVTRDQVLAALGRFQGPLLQRPPRYAALKQRGRPLYALARAGEAVEPAPRPVEIYRLALRLFAPPLLVVEAEVSAGTYLRALARDLGRALGTGAHLSGLVRLASGTFHLREAVPLADLCRAFALGTWSTCARAPDEALLDLPAIVVDATGARALRHGQLWRPPAMERWPAGQTARAYTVEGAFIGVVVATPQGFQPRKVL